MVTELSGIVLRATDIKESDRLLTIYTDKMGIITALAKGARSIKSRKLASTQQFCYSNFIIYGVADKLYVREAELVESFYSVRDSIESLALAMYVTEVIENVATAEPDSDLLRLTLNTLYAIGKGTYGLDKVKAAFEMRTVTILGFMPDVLSCSRCERTEGDFFFDVMAGALECNECHKLSDRTNDRLTDPHESSILCILTDGAKNALAYSIYAPLEKLFSFNIGAEDMRLFSRAAEEYILNHLERSFRTLEFYNEVKR